MTPDELRAMQAPLKERYLADPGAAVVTLRAAGDVSAPDVSCRLSTGKALVEALHLHPRWRLIDLWFDTWLVGSAFLQVEPHGPRAMFQPQWEEAALVLGVVTLSCLSYLILRIRAVEIVK